MIDSLRRVLLDCADAALRTVHGRAAVATALRRRMCSTPEFFASRACVVFAVGKASMAMAEGAIDVLGSRISRVLVIQKARGAHAEVSVSVLPSGGALRGMASSHPVPDERSLRAGDALLDAVDALSDDEMPLFLVSGGTSSLVEVLAAGVTLDDLAAFNRAALAGGAGIEAINLGRARLSRIKAGGLTRRLGDRPALALFVSDVPTDDPAVIGSGLLAKIAGDRVEREIVASVSDAREAVAVRASELGWADSVHVRDRRFDDDVGNVARELLSECTHAPRLLVAGGESTVRLPAQPGRGGRNQQLALIVARAIQGDPDVACLAIGTDGDDGVTNDAGGLVDGETWQRILDSGIDPQHSLDHADAGPALEASGDLVHTGPTGTNVGDLFLFVRQSPHGDPDSPVL